jgi:hypothetical protein
MKLSVEKKRVSILMQQLLNVLLTYWFEGKTPVAKIFSATCALSTVYSPLSTKARSRATFSVSISGESTTLCRI